MEVHATILEKGAGEAKQYSVNRRIHAGRAQFPEHQGRGVNPGAGIHGMVVEDRGELVEKITKIWPILIFQGFGLAR